MGEFEGSLARFQLSIMLYWVCDVADYMQLMTDVPGLMSGDAQRAMRRCLGIIAGRGAAVLLCWINAVPQL